MGSFIKVVRQYRYIGRYRRLVSWASKVWNPNFPIPGLNPSFRRGKYPLDTFESTLGLTQDDDFRSSDVLYERPISKFLFRTLPHLFLINFSWKLKIQPPSKGFFHKIFMQNCIQFLTFSSRFFSPSFVAMHLF